MARKNETLSELEESLALSKKMLAEAISAMKVSADEMRTQLQNKSLDFLKPLEIVGNLIQSGLLVCDEEGTIILANTIAKKMFQYDCLKNIKIDKIIELQLDDQTQDASFYAWIKAKNINVISLNEKSTTLRGIKHNQETFYISASISAYPIREGGKHFIFLIDDVSKIVENQKENISLLQKYQSLSNAINLTDNVGICLIEHHPTQQKIIYCSKGFTKITGYTDVTVLAAGTFLLAGPDTEKDELDRLQYCITHQIPYSGYMKCYDLENREFYGNIRVSVVTTNNNDKKIISVYCEDVTSRHNLVYDLKKKIKILDYMEEVAGVGWWIFDYDTKNLTWSKGCFDIHEVTAEEYRPDIFSALAFYQNQHEQETIKKYLSETILTQKPFDISATLKTAKGKIKKVYVKGVSFKDDTGNNIVFGIISDLTFKIDPK
jgi:PAS domain S-box-containing protein